MPAIVGSKYFSNTSDGIDSIADIICIFNKLLVNTKRSVMFFDHDYYKWVISPDAYLLIQRLLCPVNESRPIKEINDIRIEVDEKIIHHAGVEYISIELVRDGRGGLRSDFYFIDEMHGVGTATIKPVADTHNKDYIKKVIHNDPATIIFWKDGSKTVVKCKDEKYDPEKGFAMAVCKKVFGNDDTYYSDVVKKYMPEEKEPEPQPKHPYCVSCLKPHIMLGNVSCMFCDCGSNFTPKADVNGTK